MKAPEVVKRALGTVVVAVMLVCLVALGLGAAALVKLSWRVLFP